MCAGLCLYTVWWTGGRDVLAESSITYDFVWACVCFCGCGCVCAEPHMCYCCSFKWPLEGSENYHHPAEHASCLLRFFVDCWHALVKTGVTLSKRFTQSAKQKSVWTVNLFSLLSDEMHSMTTISKNPRTLFSFILHHLLNSLYFVANFSNANTPF